MGKKITPEDKTSVENTNVVVAEKPKKKRVKKTVAAVPPPEEVIVETATTIENNNIDTVVEDTTTIDNNSEILETDTEIVENNVVENEKTVEKKKRRVVSKETFLKSAEEIQKEILPLLEDNKKLTKTFKVFLNDAFRLLRIKTHQKKQKDASNSGFMRPVKPSSTLESFLAHVGEDTTKPLTRAHLTTVICKYIKDNNLQNPKDRRIIFPDEEFKKLFHITENDTEPLTYYNIQKRIQHHVSRIENTDNVAVVA